MLGLSVKIVLLILAPGLGVAVLACQLLAVAGYIRSFMDGLGWTGGMGWVGVDRRDGQEGFLVIFAELSIAFAK